MTDPDTDPERKAVARLTEKERDCLTRWLHHATAKEIALDLGVTHHAVEKRLKSARQKLDVSTSLEAARLFGRVEGYGRAASGSPELSIAAESVDILRHAVSRPETPGLSRRRATVSGVILMSLLLTTLAVALAGQPAVTASFQPSAQSSTVTYIGPDKGLDEKIADSFAKLDRDGSGFIEKSEMESIKFTLLDKRTSGADSSAHTPAIAVADGNSDGRVSLAEYRTWFQNLLPSKS